MEAAPIPGQERKNTVLSLEEEGKKKRQLAKSRKLEKSVIEWTESVTEWFGLEETSSSCFKPMPALPLH